MGKNATISRIADEIMHKIAKKIMKDALLKERPSYYKTPEKSPRITELQKDKSKAKDDLKRIWNEMGRDIVDDLKRKEKTPELEEFQKKVKEIVVKRGLPDNRESADWLDKELKSLTMHDWLIPPSSFNPSNPTTIQAFKTNEMKK